MPINIIIWTFLSIMSLNKMPLIHIFFVIIVPHHLSKRYAAFVFFPKKGKNNFLYIKLLNLIVI